MPSVAGDGSAFVIAASCSTPSATSPAVVTGTSSVSSGSGATIMLTVSVGGSAAAGMYRLCSRWTSSSPYVDVDGLNVVSVTSVWPNVIAASASESTVGVSGAGLLDVSSDGSAFVVSSSACSGAPSSVVTGVASSFVSATSVTLSVSASGAAAGVYSLCLRTSSTSAYFATGVSVTIGLFCFFVLVVCLCFCVGLTSSMNRFCRYDFVDFAASPVFESEWSDSDCEWIVDAECVW